MFPPANPHGSVLFMCQPFEVIDGSFPPFTHTVSMPRSRDTCTIVPATSVSFFGRNPSGSGVRHGLPFRVLDNAAGKGEGAGKAAVGKAPSKREEQEGRRAARILCEEGRKHCLLGCWRSGGGISTEMTMPLEWATTRYPVTMSSSCCTFSPHPLCRMYF